MSSVVARDVTAPRTATDTRTAATRTREVRIDGLPRRHPGTPATEKVGRRALIRRAATLAAAGIGGVAATEMLTASPASAATGTMMFGQANAAGASNTSLTSSADSSTLEISHTAKVANVRLAPVDDAGDYGGGTTPAGDPGGTMLGGELLNLTETVSTNAGTSTVDTLFWMAGDNGAALR